MLAFTDIPSASFSDLMITVASYFPLNTSTTEREVEAAVVTIRSVFFRVFHLQGVKFADASGKPSAVPDTEIHPADLTNFKFYSVVSTIDDHAPDKSLFIVFFLRLPQTFIFFSPSSRIPVIPNTTVSTAPVPISTATSDPPKSAASISFQLRNYIDEVLKTLAPDDMRQLLSDTRTVLFPRKL